MRLSGNRSLCCYLDNLFILLSCFKGLCCIFYINKEINGIFFHFYSVLAVLHFEGRPFLFL
nr:MAG TPA: hypothetical protein [Caudoviricetes sp.]